MFPPIIGKNSVFMPLSQNEDALVDPSTVFISMVKPHFFFICWDDNKKAEILSSNLRFNNYIGFSPGEGNQVSVLFVFSYG